MTVNQLIERLSDIKNKDNQIDIEGDYLAEEDGTLIYIGGK